MTVPSPINPFGGGANPRLRIPQARVLSALLPPYPDDPPSEWPLLNRAVMGLRAGYTAISGSITRALNGIHPDSSSGDPHLGLLALGYVETVEIDVEGVIEVNYRITRAGVQAIQRHVATKGKELPKVRDRLAATNHKYRKTQQ